jgi:hypothetical protein
MEANAILWHMHKDAAKNDDFALLIFKADKQDASRY